jgi:hypothetical protein
MRHRLDILRSSLLPLAVAVAACGGSASEPAPADLPEREVFIAAYVDLRVEALTTQGGELTDEGRAEVLGRHSVTEDQLIAFVEYWGEELDYMREVWNDIELRLDAQRPAMDDAR